MTAVATTILIIFAHLAYVTHRHSDGFAVATDDCRAMFIKYYCPTAVCYKKRENSDS